MPVPTHVVVHPLVLLSVVDHYNRLAKGSRKRVVGVLLGEMDGQGRVDITNSYAGTSLPLMNSLITSFLCHPSYSFSSSVPFDEKDNTGIWFLDHNFHEAMALAQ